MFKNHLIRSNVSGRSMRPADIEMDINSSLTMSPMEIKMIRESAFEGNLSLFTENPTNISTINKQKTDNFYTQFLEVIQSRTNDSEIFETVQDLIQVLSNAIEDMEISNLHWIRQEVATWKLLFCLYKDRLIVQKENMEMEDLPLTRSEKTIVENLYVSNENLREYQLIVDWLEQTASEFHVQVGHYTDRTVAWENTLHQLQNLGQTVFGGNREIVKSMDPDAVYREKLPLHDLDMEDEARLTKQIFQELRQGRIEQAQSLCVHCGQPWRAALLEGWRLYHDPNMDNLATRDTKMPSEGNPNRDLWKKCAWMTSESRKVDEYSRAIAGLFAGNLEAVANVLSNSYTDLLWAYLKVQIDICVESEIRSSCFKNFTAMPEKYWNGKMSLEKIFEELEAHKNLAVRKAAKSPVSLIQKYLILDDIPGLMKCIDNWLDESNSLISPQMLRFLTHTVLFMRQIGKNHQEEIGDKVIKAYVKCLIKMGSAQLVSFYTAALPIDIQNQLYSEFLESTEDTLNRKLCLEEAQAYGLDIFAITRITVERIRNETEELDGMKQLEGQLSPLDLKKISCLEWLTFYPDHRGELLWQANALMRNFLAENKVEAMKKSFSAIPVDTIQIIISNYGGKSNLPFKIECSIKEYLCHQTYLAAIEGYNDWIEFYYNAKPKEPNFTQGRNFTERVAVEHKEQIYQTELARWKTGLIEQTKITKDLLYNVLVFPERGWLVDPEDNVPSEDVDAWDNRRIQMESLRKLHIPEIILLLHKILSLSGQHRECLKLCDEIASETHHLYKVYSKHKLAELLSKIAESSLSSLSAPEKTDPFGYTISN